MADKAFRRKLSAILSAEVKGYSRLMGEDDEHPINTFTTCRKIITKWIEVHYGRIFNAPCYCNSVKF